MSTLTTTTTKAVASGLLNVKNNASCVLFHGGYCRTADQLDPVYVYIGMVTLTLIIILFILTVFVIRRKTLVRRREGGVLLFSLLCSHFLNNAGILSLTTVQVIKGFVPETSFKEYKTMHTLSMICTTFETVVSTNILVLTMDRFLTIYLNLRYEQWLTSTKQNAILCGAWVGPIILAGIISVYEGNENRHVIYLGTLILINSTTLVVVVVVYAYITQNLKSHLRAMVHISLKMNRVNEQKRSRKKMAKIFQIFFWLVLCFVLAYSFDLCIKVLRVTKKYVSDELVITGYYLFTINSLCNAIIYVVTNKLLKKSLKDFFKRKNGSF